MVDAFKDHALDKNQLATANCMLDSMTTREIAAKLGVSTGTAFNWTKDPEVVAYVQAVRAETAEQAADLRVRGALIGLRTLIDVATNRKNAPSPRVAAAGKLVDVCMPRRHEVSGPNGAPVQTMQIDPAALEGLSEEDLVQARALLGRLIR